MRPPHTHSALRLPLAARAHYEILHIFQFQVNILSFLVNFDASFDLVLKFTKEIRVTRVIWLGLLELLGN